MSSQSKEDAGADADYSFLDQVLSKMYDFGDDSRAGRKKKKCNKRKRQKLDMVSSEDLSGDDDDDGLGDGEEGGDGPADPGMLPESQSRAGGRRTGETTEVETVTFRDPFKKKNKTESKDSEIKLPQPNEKGEKAPKSFGLETARLEVHRFGIAGFQKQQQRLFERERAIMLGARPPKREYVNYKVYQQTLKEKKQEKKEMKSETKKKKKKQETRKKVEKRKSSGELPTGQVGRFKNGMLILSSKEIQSIKHSRVIK